MLRSLRSNTHRAIPIPRVRIAALCLLTGCLVDTDDPCSPNQVVLESGFVGCVCAPGSVINAAKDGCTPCGANEIIKENACTCAPGFARLTAGGACAMSSVGAACTDSAGCSGDFPFCAPGGYCSKSGCAQTTDCPAGYACETSASPPYCSRPPKGQGDACDPTMGAAACPGEANYCAAGGASPSCAVSGCATTKTCHGDWACCDFKQFGLADLCVAPSALSGGKCPGTNADPVKR